MKILFVLLLLPFFAHSQNAIDNSDNSTGDFYIEPLTPAQETINSVTCGGLSVQSNVIRQGSGQPALSSGIIYSFKSESCKKAAALQADTIRMQHLREVAETILVCQKIKESMVSSSTNDESIKDLLLFCK